MRVDKGRSGPDHFFAVWQNGASERFTIFAQLSTDSPEHFSHRRSPSLSTAQRWPEMYSRCTTLQVALS